MNWILERLKEPSTYIGILAEIANALAWRAEMLDAAMAILLAVLAAVPIFLPELGVRVLKGTATLNTEGDGGAGSTQPPPKPRPL